MKKETYLRKADELLLIYSETFDLIVNDNTPFCTDLTMLSKNYELTITIDKFNTNEFCIHVTNKENGCSYHLNLENENGRRIKPNDYIKHISGNTIAKYFNKAFNEIKSKCNQKKARVKRQEKRNKKETENNNNNNNKVVANLASNENTSFSYPLENNKTTDNYAQYFNKIVNYFIDNYKKTTNDILMFNDNSVEYRFNQLKDYSFIVKIDKNKEIKYMYITDKSGQYRIDYEYTYMPFNGVYKTLASIYNSGINTKPMEKETFKNMLLHVIKSIINNEKGVKNMNNNKNLRNYYFNKMIELIAQYSICMDIDKHLNVKTYQANGNNYYLTIKTINDNKLLSIEIGHGIAKWILEFDKNGNIASDIKSSYFNVELLKALKDIKDKFMNDLTYDKYDFIADLLSEFQVGYNYDRYDTNNLKALADYGMIEEENINDFIIKMKKIPDDHLTTEIVIYNLNEFGLDFLVNGEFYEYSDYSEYIDMFLENFGSDTREFYDRYISYLIDEKDLFEYLTKYETFAETEYGTILEIIDY